MGSGTRIYPFNLEGSAPNITGVDQPNHVQHLAEPAPKTNGIVGCASDVNTQGHIVTFGGEDTEQALPPSPPVLALACGRRHSALVLHGGKLATFGCEDHRQRGLGRGQGTRDPTTVDWPFGKCGFAKMPSLSACRRDTAPGEAPLRGTIDEKGNSPLRERSSENGRNHDNNRDEWGRELLSPMTARLQVSVRGVSCGNNHTAAVGCSGAVWTWGAGAGGVLGHGDQKPLNTPRRVSGRDNVSEGSFFII